MKKRLLKAGILLGCLLLCGCTPAGKGPGETVIETGAAGESNETSDGLYIPGHFEWSGGSGKVTISCPQVREADGQTLATLVFSSSHYTYVRVGDETYYGTSDEETSSFEIPVVLDEYMTIAAETTAMSQPHEIEYEIYVSLAVIEDDFPPDGMPEETEGEPETISDSFGVPEIEGLSYVSSMDPEYAQCFNVYEYSDGFQVVDVPLSGQYLILPEDGKVPGNLPENMTVISRPLSHIYVAATSSMALFDAIGALDMVTLTGTDAGGWAIEAPRAAIESGRMTFAGKYSAPDYELLLEQGCDLAVESTMIWHKPQVKEMLEDLGIPVFVDRSSFEETALGRMEWIRLYGVLTGKADEADAFFETQAKASAMTYEPTGMKAAWFSFNQSGQVNVRAADDYIVRMIEDGGASYALAEAGEGETSKALRNVSMETFYAAAVDADFLIYNATIADKLTSVDDLLAKDSIFADFKAVKEGHVWQADQTLYQSTDHVSSLTGDIHRMLTGEDPEQMVFLKHLD